MDLRALRYFLGVVRSGSFSRAAEKLNVAQPALSRQIQKLEDEIGAPLLVRHPRGVELTARGAMLVERAEEVLDLFSRINEDLRAPESAVSGQVTLGTPPATGLIVVPELLARFESALPKVSLHIREGVGSSLVEWVQDGRADFALVHNPATHPDLIVEPLVTERMVLVLPLESVETSWAAPSAAEISLADAIRLPLLMPSKPHTNRLMIDRILARSDLALRPRMEIDSVAITKALVARGAGATLLTYSAVFQDLSEGRLRAIPIDRPALVSTLAMVRRRDAPASAALEWGERVLRETLVDVIRNGRLRGAHETERLKQDD